MRIKRTFAGGIALGQARTVKGLRRLSAAPRRVDSPRGWSVWGRVHTTLQFIVRVVYKDMGGEA